MDEKKVGIIGLGKYLPENRLTNKDLEKIVDTTDEWIMERTGIKERRIARESEATSDMAVNAAKKALESARLKPDDIGLIIVATITPDMFFPSTACLVQDKIGAKNAWGFDLSAACSGFLFALQVGANMITSGAYKKVVVVGADKMSSITDYTDRTTCIILGDGAAAVLLEPTEDLNYGIKDALLYTDGSGGEALYMKAGGILHPATHETVDKKWHYMYQDGSAVFTRSVSPAG